MTDEMRNYEKAITEIAGVEDIGDVSDGFHTFNQLYHQRALPNRSMANNRMYNRTRTSYNNSYDNDAKMDFMAEVESLVNKAPDEHTRMKIERMLNDLR